MPPHFELGDAVVISGLWKWPSLNGRVAIVREFSEDLPGHVNLGVREQFSNGCLFWEVERFPQVLFLRHVPLRNLHRHLVASMDVVPPERPRWRSKAVDQQTRPPSAAAAAAAAAPPLKRQRTFASAAERDALEVCDLADAVSEGAKV